MNEKYKYLKAEIFHYDCWVNTTDVNTLKSYFEKTLQNNNFQIVNFTEHHFEVNGYTCVWLLAESHLAIHTFPNQSKSYVQLSSCNEQKKKSFVQELANSEFIKVVSN